ncbi:fibronectin type-III domain-containing protein [Caerostris darwini]|uniref:Fibronectin type-III domain-containing protein n=1 Tax=Caerostris darwini TaxID=1538125 RepID=A0AAV4V2R5_9ARAC|nr:fibronectin type-III domain-containing protein [Caerostris darwini]
MKKRFGGFFSEPPNEVQNCTSAEETETSFKVFCNASLDDSNGLEEHFYVEVRDSETGDLLQNYSLNFPEVAVRGLDPGIWYRVSVYVTNEAGRSKPYIIEIRTIPKPETTNVPGTAWIIEVSSLIFIVSAVVGGLLLVLVMLCCVLKFRLARRKSKDSLSGQGTEKSAHNSEKSGDSCSDGCTCSGREDEKIRENIPDHSLYTHENIDISKKIPDYSQATHSVKRLCTLFKIYGAINPQSDLHPYEILNHVASKLIADTPLGTNCET